ncbi:MAG TPA: hypothetical protein VM658_21645 [bacterium]|nr:hypothetical protein [bacterium]
MPTPRAGARPDDIRSRARHTLFVEGIGEASLDAYTCNLILRDLKISVQPMGPAYHVKAVAQALHDNHPSYYFLIDRDHIDDAAVEKSWKEFPDPASFNLLIWRRREIENYFLDPDYLAASSYLVKSPKVLRREIASLAGKRIYLDAANLVIIRLRETLKENWIKCFDKVNGFESKAKALEKLLSAKGLADKAGKVAKDLGAESIEENFEQTVNYLLGNSLRPEYGQGKWLEMVKGKEILPTVINRCFRVKGTDGKNMQGIKAVREVARDLLSQATEFQPHDFSQLYKLLKKKIAE